MYRQGLLAGGSAHLCLEHLEFEAIETSAPEQLVQGPVGIKRAALFNTKLKVIITRMT